MIKTVSRKTLLLFTVLVLVLSVLFVFLLSLDNIANADAEEVPEHQTIRPYSTNSSDRATARNVVVDYSRIERFIVYGVKIIIDPTVENITFTNSRNLKMYGSKIVIESRKTDLNMYFDGIKLGALDNETAIINNATKGTVHFINIGSEPVYIFGGDRTDAGSYKDGLGISGVVCSKGDISFEGENGFIIDGAGNSEIKTYLGNMHYGNIGLQVKGFKKVYINTTVNVFGGCGLRGQNVGQLGYNGGHGGYGYEGQTASVIIGENGYLTLKGGKGGNGADLPKSGILGKKGYGGAAYNGNINVNDTSKFEYEDGEDGRDGYFYAL